MTAAPLPGWRSTGELCHLQPALEPAGDPASSLWFIPTVPNPVEEELAGRRRRLVTLGSKRLNSWGTSLKYCISEDSDGCTLMLFTNSLPCFIHLIKREKKRKILKFRDRKSRSFSVQSFYSKVSFKVNY